MTQETKVTDAELKQLKEIRDKVEDLIVFVGQMELQKTLLESDIETAKSEFKDLFVNEQKLLKEISDKYGSNNIDLETGIIT